MSNARFNANITVSAPGFTAVLPAVVEITSSITGDILHEGQHVFIAPDGVNPARGCTWRKDLTPESQYGWVVGFSNSKKIVIEGHNLTLTAVDTVQLGSGGTRVVVQRQWVGNTIGAKGPSGRFALNSYQILPNGSTEYRQHIFGTVWNGNAEELHYFFNSWDAPTGVKVLDLPNTA